MTRSLRIVAAAAAMAVGAVACGNVGGPETDPIELGASPPAESQIGEGGSEADGSAEASTTSAPRRVDPRKGGFEVGFGEYAVTLEAQAIRPGPVTFEVTNGGKLVHGFEIENESQEGDSSGPGSGEDGFKMETESIQPGETLRFQLDLSPGLHKVECWVDGHDDLGMEIMLEVREDAPKVRQETVDVTGDAVSIRGFAFEPADLQVAPGTEVTWTNDDPEAHTVSADDGSFDSGVMDPGATFSTVVDGSGAVTYICQIHPAMKGTITVG